MEFTGDGLNGDVYALVIGENGDIYTGGIFDSAGGIETNHIARWDGMRWSSLGNGLNGDVYTLVVDENGDIYAGGFR